MQRRPEPELMDDRRAGPAYAEADFSEPNELFLRLLAEQNPATPAADAARWTSAAARRTSSSGCCAAIRACAATRWTAASRCSTWRAALEPLPGIASRVRLLCDKLPSARWSRRLRPGPLQQPAAPPA
jgi:hypothetical protein